MEALHTSNTILPKPPPATNSSFSNSLHWRTLAVDNTCFPLHKWRRTPVAWSRGSSGLARLAKERTYPELIQSGRCRPIVLAVEVGATYNREAAQFLRVLAQGLATISALVLRPGPRGHVPRRIQPAAPRPQRPPRRWGTPPSQRSADTTHTRPPPRPGWPPPIDLCPF